MQSPPAPPPAPRRGFTWLLIGLALLTLLCTASLMPLLTIMFGQIQLADGGSRAAYVNPLILLFQSGCIAAVCARMIFNRNRQRSRAIARAVLVAAAMLIVLAPLHALFDTRDVLFYALALIIGSVVQGLCKRMLRTPAVETPAWSWLSLLPWAVLGLLPWLLRGALGSALDTLLALAIAILFGRWLAWLDQAFMRPAFAPESGGARTNTLWRGLGLGVCGLLLARAFGFNGHALLLMAAVAPLGIALAAATQAPAQALPARLAFLASAAAFGALAFSDAKEFNIAMGGDDIPGVLAISAPLVFLIGSVISAILWLWPQLAGSIGPISVRHVIRAGLATVAGLGLHLGLGMPGLYADDVFVIRKLQADPAVAVSPDAMTRRAEVFRALTVAHTADQAPLRNTLNTLGLRHTPYYLVNAIEIASPLDGGALIGLWLRMQSDTDRVLISPSYRPISRALGGVPRPQATAPGTAAGSPNKNWGLINIRAADAWNTFAARGKGIVVGNTDSGIDGGHEALRDAYRGNGGSDDYNWLDPWGNTRSPVDYGSHGTHTTGSVLGRGVGVAPDAQWIGCVNLARAFANPALYLDCMQFVLAPFPQGGDPFTQGRPELGAHVVNNSWGCPDLEGCDATVFQPAMRALRQAGVFMVVSAGNSGPACSTIESPPALYDDAFTVGAVGSNGDITDFSSRGPVMVDGSGRSKPDILAPGDLIESSVPNNGYEANSGTSMAGPHVAGVVALIWSANPKLIGNITLTEQILRDTATRYAGANAIACAGADAGPQTSNVFGAGTLNAFEAVKRAVQLR